MGSRRRSYKGLWRALMGSVVLVAAGALAQDRPTLTFYGTPGLVDMPTAESMPDGEVSLTVNKYGKTQRNVLTFQLTPRLSGSFRYSILEDYFDPPSRTTLYDRSFDLRYRFVDEGTVMPAFAVGLQDFGGTGIFGGEYVAATKHFGRKLTVTGGIGWGRFGTYGSFENPLAVFGNRFKTRPGFDGNITNTGRFEPGRFFRGPAALFGGLEYSPTEKLAFEVEYSSDDQSREEARMGIDHNSPINVAATYRFQNGVDLTAAYLYGSSVGLNLSWNFNPKTPPNDGIELAGPAVVPRDMAAAMSWGDVGGNRGTVSQSDLTRATKAVLASEKLELKGLDVTGDTATIHLVNNRFSAVPEALGRAARGLTGVMPPQVETFVLVPVSTEGMPLSSVTIRRSDLEELEYALDNSWESYARADIRDAAHQPVDGAAIPGAYPDLTWGYGPYFSPSYFDPADPVRADIGVRVNGTYTVAPGLSFSGMLRQPLFGNLDQYARPNDSVLPHVRTDTSEYDKAAELEVTYLTGDYFFRPGTNLYGHVSAGLLERQYAGVAGEVLWKPVEGPWAFGVEVAYARKRDYDVLFQLRDYDIVTGHASAYYDFGNGFLGEIDAGRYLAGDWGATFSLDREFNNGFTLGAFFTLTDVSPEEFGEGSFDKGVRISVPITWLTGQRTQGEVSQTLRPVVRDGGARLDLRNRLYDKVRGYHDPELQEDWGRFWR